MHVLPQTRIGPLLSHSPYRDTKDPCPVWDGQQWHLYGSGGSSVEEGWEILHAKAHSPRGPWQLTAPATLIGVSGPHVAAPGVVFDPQTREFHLFIQTEFLMLGGTIEHLVSADGETFLRRSTVLESLPLTTEAGIYDPHPAIINGRNMLCYSAMADVSRPDLYLAVSETNTWDGPWKREGRILAHEDVPHHNQRGSHDYEWGLEGAQLVGLPSGRVMLCAVCFLPQGDRGTRQRVFLAFGPQPKGPYYTAGAILETGYADWERGENGHAAGMVVDGSFLLFYQGREGDGKPWQYGLAEYAVTDIEDMAEHLLKEKHDHVV